MGFNSAFKGLM